MDLEKIKMKVLEDLEGAMDRASLEGYKKGDEPRGVAVVEEKTVIPVEAEGAGDPAGVVPGESTQDPKRRPIDSPVYLNPDRQKVLDEVENQSADAGEGFDKESMLARMKRKMANA